MTAAQRRIWTDVSKSRQRTGCTCNLRPAMDYNALRPLNGGCTDTPARQGARWVCSTLDQYRRMVGMPAATDD